MCLPVVKGTYPNGMWYDGHYAGTWYGYMQKLGNNSGGTMMNIKAAWGNGFKLDKAKAGLSKAGRYTRSTYHSAIGSTGWGLHVLETTDGFGDDTDPIDSYDILTKPGSPDHCESPKNETKKTPKYDNTGTRTIVKTYVDLYKDKNNSGHYTAAIDSGTFMVDDCSEKVVISNEFNRTGYSVKAWYTSKSLPSADEENYKGTSMLHKGSSTASTVGDQSYTIEGYTQMSGVTFNGSKSYKMQKSRTVDGKLVYFDASTNTGNKNYTRTNAIPKTGSISRIKTASTSQYVKLGEDDQTIVILYVREHGYIDSSTFTETSINNDPHQELKIVKCYGILNPATFEVENDKDTIYTTSKTRNVNVKDEDGYRFAEFVYCTRGSSSYSSMTASKWCQVKGDEKSKNNQFYVKGFIDGFSASPFGSSTYNSQYAWGIYKPADMATMHGERDIHDSAEYAGGAIASTGTYKGTKGRGRLSGDILDGYNKTIYFGGVSMQDTTNTNTSDDVLYLLFLKDDEVEYEVGDFGIPESYITRRNNFATNNIKVGGVTGSSSKQYSFAKHQFKYSLPAPGTVQLNYPNIFDYTWSDNIIISTIDQCNTSSAGLIPSWCKTNKVSLVNGVAQCKDITGVKYKDSASSSSYKLLDKCYASAYSTTSLDPGVVSFQNVNYYYVAHRKDDNITLAKWKINAINNKTTFSSNYYSTGDCGKSAYGMKIAYNVLDGINDNLWSIANSPKQYGDRQDNDSVSSYDITLNFTDIMASKPKRMFIYVPIANNNDALLSNFKKKLIRHVTATAKEKYNGSDKTIEEASTFEYDLQSNYMDKISDLNLIQSINIHTHYGAAISNPYSDKAGSVASGSGKSAGLQVGGYKVMEADNTFDFYTYHVMQFDTESVSNTFYKAQEVNGKFVYNTDEFTNKNSAQALKTKSGVSQTYVLGEEQRHLNVFSYGGVVFKNGSAFNKTSNTVNIVNQASNNATGKMIISSDQWSTHARATAATEGKNNCVLPGGAALSLSIPNDNRQVVTVKTYTPLLAGTGYEQVNATGSVNGMYTKSDLSAIEKTHNDLVKSVAAGVESLNVQQYAMENTKSAVKNNGTAGDITLNTPTKNLWDDKAIAVGPGVKDGNVTLSTEDKYYFREDGDTDKDGKEIDGLAKSPSGITDGAANTGDLDTDVYAGTSVNVPAATKTYYTFYMNRKGQVYVNSDSNVDKAANVNITGLEGYMVCASKANWKAKNWKDDDATVSDIIEKTGILDQLYTQLEEATGNDESAIWADSQGHWYFEAFDGITIAAYETNIKVGFIDSYERTSVLDPKLTPKANSKGDILKDYIYSQFKMQNTSLRYGEANQIGEYKAFGNTYKIKVPDLSMLFVSDIFIIPNATVQDLK
jgi:hypothetical protein